MKSSVSHLMKAGAVAGVLMLSGCSFLIMGYQRQFGSKVTAQYKGLADKSVAIVVYSDQANTFEYPQTRWEISTYVAAAMRKAMPKIKLLNPDDVIAWQDATMNWQSMPEKDIGKHFGVDRVVYIEVVEYGTREPQSTDLLLGRIRTTCEVYETDSPAVVPAWKQEVDAFWPEEGPLDASHGNDNVVRQHVLGTFSSRLTSAFYDHRAVDTSLRDSMEQQ